MATELIVQGGSIELADDESFNKARQRLTDAKKMLIDYENQNIDGVTKGDAKKGVPSQVFKPFHKLSFMTAEGGRVCVDPAKVIGVTSTEPKDVGGYDEDDDE